MTPAHVINDGDRPLNYFINRDPILVFLYHVPRIDSRAYSGIGYPRGVLDIP